MDNTYLERGIALGICAGMRHQEIANTLGISLHRVFHIVKRIYDKSGMDGRVEFALQQNAAIRERLHGVESGHPAKAEVRPDRASQPSDQTDKAA